MANIAVTYTFSPLAKADANALYQNFVDIVNGLKDETKTLAMNNVTCTGLLSAAVISFPAASLTVPSSVYAGYSHITYAALPSTWTGSADSDLSISGTPTESGSGVLEITSTDPLKITALVDCKVTVHWDMAHDRDTKTVCYLNKNNSTVLQKSREPMFAFGYNLVGPLASTFVLEAGDYFTFRMTTEVPTAFPTMNTRLNISAIQVG